MHASVETALHPTRGTERYADGTHALPDPLEVSTARFTGPCMSAFRFPRQRLPRSGSLWERKLQARLRGVNRTPPSGLASGRIAATDQ